MADGLLDNVSIHLVESMDDLFAFKRWVGERREGVMAVDTESGGLSPWKDELRLVQFGDMRTGWTIPWDMWKGGILEIIRDYEGEWACHNAPFEQKFFKVHGDVQLPWERLHDTMVQAKLEDPTRPAGLKPLSSRIVDRTAAQGQQALDDGMKAQGWTWATVPISFAPYWVYAALDTVLTSHVDHQLRPKIQASYQESYDLEMATLRICTNMMLKGMKINVPYVQEAIEKFQKFSDEAREWLTAAHGVTSPLSAGQLSRAFTALGCEITQYTDQGAPQMNKDVLEYFQTTARDPRARQLAQYTLAVRHADKMRGTYLENFLAQRDVDDIIHASINTMAARTHRMSVSEPSLQNLPRADTAIRGSFEARADGLVLGTVDLDQVEARMAAHFSEDPGLLQAFINADTGGSDFFCELASYIYGEEISKKDTRRDMVKTIVYRSNYGGGDNVVAMAAMAGVSLDQMNSAKESFDARFPGIKRILQDVCNDAKRHNPPYIFSPTGRKFGMLRGEEYTQGFNSLIQGHAAEYFKKCLVNMDAAGIGDKLLLPVHDEILFETERDGAEEVLRTVEDCMTDRTTYRVPITAGGKIMDRWAK